MGLIQENGLEGLSEIIRLMVNQAMQFERENFLNARAYVRSEDGTGYANAYKPKTVNTRVGKVTFAIPQVREGNFYPHALEKGMRSERALLLALAEMYVRGVNTRKVAAITEQLCGTNIKRSTLQAAQHASR